MEVLGWLFCLFFIGSVIEKAIEKISEENRILAQEINRIERKLDLILNYHGIQPEISKEDIFATPILERCPNDRKIEV